ncbi:MAG: DUF5709 domain-containing protein [Janthinobacterium lividum]
MSTYQNEVPDESEQLDVLDTDETLEDSAVKDPLDTGYTTAENYSPLIRVGEHEDLDERLAEEVPEPDPYAEDDLDEDDGLSVRADEENLDDGEVGDARAGRLVDPDQGLGDDVDADLIGQDVGIDGAAASAEEAAVHVVPE